MLEILSAGKEVVHCEQGAFVESDAGRLFFKSYNFKIPRGKLLWFRQIIINSVIEIAKAHKDSKTIYWRKSPTVKLCMLRPQKLFMTSGTDRYDGEIISWRMVYSDHSWTPFQHEEGDKFFIQDVKWEG